VTALQTLGLPPTATVDEIKTRWRELASVHHPDHGGDAATFHAMRQAYAVALKLAGEPVRCPECNGLGKTTVVHGFGSVKMTCQMCHGQGELIRE
jgi:DnaJ-class molecular chaperone